jgi:hypothetical protein
MGKLCKRSLAVAVLACRVVAATGAPAGGDCDASLKWLEDGNLASVRYREPSAWITTRRYQDAMRVDVTGPDGRAKGILELERGPTLLFGSSDPREFQDAGQPAFIPVYYLMQHYPSPCAVPADEAFSFRFDDAMMGAGPAEVEGRVRRTGSRIDYEIRIRHPAPPPGRPGVIPLDASGSWSHLPPVPVGEESDVRGWKIVNGSQSVDPDASPATVAEARAYRGR